MATDHKETDQCASPDVHLHKVQLTGSPGVLSEGRGRLTRSLAPAIIRPMSDAPPPSTSINTWIQFPL
ncbi:unnamed protein product [Gadus morhua 'NCC']